MIYNIFFAPINPVKKRHFSSNIFSKLENWQYCSIEEWGTYWVVGVKKDKKVL